MCWNKFLRFNPLVKFFFYLCHQNKLLHQCSLGRLSYLFYSQFGIGLNSILRRKYTKLIFSTHFTSSALYIGCMQWIVNRFVLSILTNENKNKQKNGRLYSQCLYSWSFIVDVSFFTFHSHVKMANILCVCVSI